MFEAICSVFDYDWNKITKNKRGQVNTTAKQLLEVGAVPDDIEGVYSYCKKKFEQFGPVALTTSWDDYKAADKAPVDDELPISPGPAFFTMD
jgi:hypothetical protein